MKLIRLIFGDMGLKVLAVAMAWSVWFMVGEGLTATETFLMDVDVRTTGTADIRTRVLDASQRVTLKISGPQSVVAQLRAVPEKRARVTVAGELVPPDDPEKQIEFRLADVEIPSLADFPELRATAMTPATVRVLVENMREEEKRVAAPKPPAEINDVQVRVIDTDPTVRVRGPLSVIKDLTTIETAIDKDQLRSLAEGMGDMVRDRQTIPLRIVPDPAGSYSLVGTEHIEARIELIKLMQRDIPSVPIQILRSPGDQRDLKFSLINTISHPSFELGSPATMTLRVEGVPRLVKALDASTILAFVLAEGVPSIPETSDDPDNPDEETPEADWNAVLHVELPDGVRLVPPANRENVLLKLAE